MLRRLRLRRKLQRPTRKNKIIIEKAKKKGYITYEEMNNELPMSISPARLKI
jgi:hypothetical protein